MAKRQSAALNYFDLSLDYIVDDNPMKWGYLTPGMNIPICAPETLAQEKDLNVVVLAWNFWEEVTGKIQKIVQGTHRCIRYVPTVMSVTNEE